MNNTYNEPNPVSEQPQFPMKWHKFLIYFSLWVSAILNLISTFTYFTGMHYGYNTNNVYMVFPSLSIIDKLLGIVFLAIAVLSIVTRFSLAGYKAIGPKLLLSIYLLNIVVGIAYVVLTSIISGIPISELMDSSSISSIVVSIAMMVYNKNYYKRRAALFVR